VRPEYVKCIADVHADHAGASLCGRKLILEFHFEDIDHWFNAARGEGRLVGCPECLQAVERYFGDSETLRGRVFDLENTLENAEAAMLGWRKKP
jgi:hypothetical protein